MDIVSINGMQVPCFIGIHRHERHEKQMLLLDLEMYLSTAKSGNEARFDTTVDYSKIYGELKFLLEACHFRMLETASQAICAYLLAPPPPDRVQAQIETVSLSLKKPSALKSEAVPGLKVNRTKADFSVVVEKNTFGEVDIIHESSDCGIYRLRIPGGGEIPAHYHDIMAEGELALSDGLLLQHEPLPAGLAHFWPQKFVHHYSNPTSDERTILCVNRPAFIPTDEIVVDSKLPLQSPPPTTKVRYF
jgi:FolB domain-containing protein